MKPVFILLGLILISLLGCGCSQPATSLPPPVAPAVTSTAEQLVPVITSSPVQTKTPSVSDNTITIRRTFDPVNITVKAGATVRWVNGDSTEDPALYNPTHRIQFADADKTTSPVLSPAQSWSLIFRSTGVFTYTDIVHKDMQGTVTVE